MIPSIDLTINVAALLAQVEGPQKQIDYAASRAINEVAFALKMSMPQQVSDGRFTVRRDWIKKGFRHRNSTKTSLTATVFHLDGYLKKQHSGAKRIPMGHNSSWGGHEQSRKVAGPGSHLMIRATGSKDTKASTLTNLPTTSEKPGGIIGSKRGFLVQMNSGAKAMMERRAGTEKGTPRRKDGRLRRELYGRRASLWKRPKGRRLKREARIRYFLTRSATVAPRLGMTAKARVLVVQLFRESFARHFAEAMRTAK